MKGIHFFVFLMLTILTGAFAQAESEEAMVIKTINLLFDGMRAGDSTIVRSAFANKITIETIAKGKDGKMVVISETLNSLLKAIGTPHQQKYDERIIFKKILIDANLASVWTDYKFYVGNVFSHCGVNSFQLFKGDDGWKIIYLIDTRRKDNCSPSVN